MIRRSWFLGALLLVASMSSARAEVVGPLLPKSTFEAGAQARWLNREIYGDKEFDWEETGVDAVLRWGATDLATVSIEASASSLWLTGEMKTPDVSYLVGGAVQASVWRNQSFIVSASFQFTTTMMRFNEGTPRNVTTATASGQIIAQYAFATGGVRFNGWAGPAYSLFYPTFEQQLTSGYRELYTQSNWGAVVGLQTLFWDHVDLNSYLLWVENPQPRVALSYRF